MSAIPQQKRLRASADGTGWFLDWIGDVQVVYLDGRVTDQSFGEYVDTLARDLDARAEDDVISFLYYVPQPTALGAERRTRLGAVLKEREKKIQRLTRTYVMATPSLVVRSSMKMIFWITPPPYPHAIVATPREGFEFIARYQAGVDPEACLVEHRRLLARAGAKGERE